MLQIICYSPSGARIGDKNQDVLTCNPSDRHLRSEMLVSAAESEGFATCLLQGKQNHILQHVASSSRDAHSLLITLKRYVRPADTASK